MISKVFQIARREFLETVKTKAFIIGISIVPVFVAGVMFFGGKLQQKAITGPREDIQVAVLNHEPAIEKSLAAAFDSYNADNPGRKYVPHFLQTGEEEAKQAVRDEEFGVLLVVDSATVSGEGHARLFSPPSTDLTQQSGLRRILNDAVTTVRYELNGFSPELVRELSRGVWLEDFQLSEKGEGQSNRMLSTMLPFFFMFIMFFGIVTSSQGLLNSVIEEKNNRVIEVLLSAISPMELMAGKILGQSGIGLTLVVIYVAGGVIALAASGLSDALSSVGGPEIAVFLAYFVLGFLLFNALFAAVGSAFNSLKEAQPVISPLMMVVALPMAFWFIIVQQPQGILAVSLSLIPPVSPLVMIMRVAALPAIPWLQVAASLLILAAAVMAITWAAARVFRVGILMYGKAPSIREMMRWVRES